jgi:hypothetical protein
VETVERDEVDDGEGEGADEPAEVGDVDMEAAAVDATDDAGDVRMEAAEEAFVARVLLSCKTFDVVSSREYEVVNTEGPTEMMHLQLGGPLRTKNWVVIQVERYGDAPSLDPKEILRRFRASMASEAVWGIAGQHEKYFLLLAKGNTIRFSPPPIPGYNSMAFSVAGAPGLSNARERIGGVVQQWLALAGRRMRPRGASEGGRS